MNRNDITTRDSALDATPGPASGAFGSPLGTAHFLTLAAAKTAADVAMSSALAKGYPVSVTVVDRDGVVIAQQRADTATGATVAVSLSKAVAAVGFQMPTAAIQEYAKTNPGAVYIQGFSILPGGLPISLDGQCRRRHRRLRGSHRRDRRLLRRRRHQRHLLTRRPAPATC